MIKKQSKGIRIKNSSISRDESTSAERFKPNSRDRKYRLDAISFEYVNVKYPILSTASPYEDSGRLEWPID